MVTTGFRVVTAATALTFVLVAKLAHAQSLSQHIECDVISPNTNSDNGNGVAENQQQQLLQDEPEFILRKKQYYGGTSDSSSSNGVGGYQGKPGKVPKPDRYRIKEQNRKAKYNSDYLDRKNSNRQMKPKRHGSRHGDDYMQQKNKRREDKQKLRQNKYTPEYQQQMDKRRLDKQKYKGSKHGSKYGYGSGGNNV